MLTEEQKKVNKKISAKKSHDKYKHKYYARNKELRLKSIAEGICSACHKCPRVDNRLCIDCRKRAKEVNNSLTKKIKLEVIQEYGGKCVCCHEHRFEFLTIDHPNNDGAKHRNRFGTSGAGRHIYRWLKSRGFPKDGYRLLCLNCNCARGFYGYCPHEIEKHEVDVDLNLLASTAFRLLRQTGTY